MDLYNQAVEELPEKRKQPMDLYNQVCKQLPHDYMISIEMENGSCIVKIIKPDMSMYHWHEDETAIHDMVKNALAWCIKDAEIEKMRIKNSEKFQGRIY